jgi:hypothetical protein
MMHINMHKRNISKFFYNVKNKRPKKLLWYNPTYGFYNWFYSWIFF